MEIWREIEPGLEVSNLGRCRRICKTHLNADGYPCISGGERNAPKIPVHRLVAQAFLGPRAEGEVIRHLNDVKTDPRLDNLCYGTRKENYADAVANGRVNPRSPEHLANLRRAAVKGGQWWSGKKRDENKRAVA